MVRVVLVVQVVLVAHDDRSETTEIRNLYEVLMRPALLIRVANMVLVAVVIRVSFGLKLLS